jgi:hypothetical protein
MRGVAGIFDETSPAQARFNRLGKHAQSIISDAAARPLVVALTEAL